MSYTGVQVCESVSETMDPSVLCVVSWPSGSTLHSRWQVEVSARVAGAG